jgi:hypothetical protein
MGVLVRLMAALAYLPTCVPFSGMCDYEYVPAKDSFTAFRNGDAFSWGSAASIGSGPPAVLGTIQLVRSTEHAWAVLDTQGYITTWGDASSGGTGGPTGGGHTAIYSTKDAFAALTSSGGIVMWGSSSYGSATTQTGYVRLITSHASFTAVHSSGTVTSWGTSQSVSANPTDCCYTIGATTETATVLLKTDTSVRTFGPGDSGGSGDPPLRRRSALWSSPRRLTKRSPR